MVERLFVTEKNWVRFPARGIHFTPSWSNREDARAVLGNLGATPSEGGIGCVICYLKSTGDILDLFAQEQESVIVIY